MKDAELRKRYAKEPWGKLLIEMGMEPYDTESSARRVAGYAAERIQKLEAEKEALWQRLMYVESYSPKKIKHPDGRVMVWHCPDDMIPVVDFGNKGE